MTKNEINSGTINWYPGHMTKAVRQMQEDIKLIDLIIELVDARIPASSKNPDIDTLGQGKSRLILLNKADMADPQINSEWESCFGDSGMHCLLINSKTGEGIKHIEAKVNEACREKKERDLKRGIKNRPVRAMVVGIPNVGKSTFINAFTGRAVTKTGNKPGVTKGKQWIKLNKNLELLDTPGILWPKFENKITGLNLAFIGSINDDILITTDLALDFYSNINKLYPGLINTYYGIEVTNPVHSLEAIALKRNCIASGDKPDLDRAARLLIEDFRSGRLGRLSLERPEGNEG